MPSSIPKDQIEQEIILRKFDGVNLLVDQAYLGPSYLRRASNWIPGETFRLTKSPGNTAYPGGNIPSLSRVRRMVRVYSGANAYLYLVGQVAAGTGDELWVSTNGGAWAHVQLTGGGNATFTQVGGTYDIEELNGTLYIGNGVDPIYSLPIGSTATALLPITAFTDGSAAPSKTSDPGAQWLTGTYAFAWAIFDNTLGIWVERGQTRTVTVTQTGDQAITFQTPTGFASNGGTLSARFQGHLFVAPINLPIEFAHDQNPDGAQAGGSVVLRVLTAGGPPLPLRGVARVGKKLRAHRGRLWVSGDPGSPAAVWATSIVQPGLEQAIFNSGVFFPYNARTPRIHEDVTAIALATTGRDDPDAPFVICGLSSTWLQYGDILDDPSAYFIEVSHSIGCIEQETMVETPHGVVFVGLESVYLVPPGGGVPIDIGWPIRPAITSIPSGQRARCRALYHKGFYKLAIVPSGATTATQQWWLDLRQGVGSVPSWWGPSKRVAVAAWCAGAKDTDETDAGYMAVDGGGVIERIHRPNSFAENSGGSTLVSILLTGDLDNGRPFDRKIFTRVRVTAFPQAQTSIQVGFSVDGGAVGPFDPMDLPAPGGAVWNVDDWNTATWGQERVVSEGESVAPTNRPRGRTGSVQLTHNENKGVAIRDFELRYLPVSRPVRSLPADPNS